MLEIAIPAAVVLVGFGFYLYHDARRAESIGPPCSVCKRPLLEWPYCTCEANGWHLPEGERRRMRIKKVIAGG